MRKRLRAQQTISNRVYSCIRAQETPVWPKDIAMKTGLNGSSVKVYCMRLAKENRIVRTPTGYTLPATSSERDLDLVAVGIPPDLNVKLEQHKAILGLPKGKVITKALRDWFKPGGKAI